MNLCMIVIPTNQKAQWNAVQTTAITQIIMQARIR